MISETIRGCLANQIDRYVRFQISYQLKLNNMYILLYDYINIYITTLNDIHPQLPDQNNLQSEYESEFGIACQLDG